MMAALRKQQEDRTQDCIEFSKDFDWLVSAAILLCCLTFRVKSTSCQFFKKSLSFSEKIAMLERSKVADSVRRLK